MFAGDRGDGPTLYVAWGDWLGWPCLSLVAVCAVAIVVGVARRPRSTSPARRNTDQP